MHMCPGPAVPRPHHPPHQAYQMMRNSLVALYRRQPQRRLTFEEAADSLEEYDARLLQR